MKIIGTLYVVLSVWLYASLPQGIEEIVRKSGIEKKDISIYIKEAGNEKNIFAFLNATTSRSPASVIKVLSTYASVLTLGFDYRFPTRFYMTGNVQNGVLNGDLLIKGYGDPTLKSRDLHSIVQQIKSQGIRRIKGNIIIDRSFFRVSSSNSSHFDENPYSPYNAMPDAMMFNERVSTICVAPNHNDVFKKSPDGSYRVLNKLQRVNKPCRGRYSWPGIKISENKAMPTVLLQGKISNRCGLRNICKVVTKPYASFYYALKDKLHKEGIEIMGNLRLRKIPPNAKVLFTHYSQPLEQIISKTAKKSNNLYARHLLLFLGAKIYGAPSTLNRGRNAVITILKKNGALREDGLIIDNGSGLSRVSRLSAKLLADMFDNAYERYGQRWMNTLSIAGVDGTIKKRFRGTVVKNRAWMKTGTLKHVKNIGGYVKNKEGKLYTVVILVQTNKGRWKAAALQNNIIKWLVNHKEKSIEESSVEHLSTQNRVTTTNMTYASTKDSTRYYVQVGSFETQPSKAYLLQLERLGLRYRVRHTDTYKVLIGAFGTQEDAAKALEIVHKKLNKSAFIIRL
ncbi:MAG: D-alanyl-D-alanine carboxypeptidase/D-alanyl-D-alanine-endopeptidase [Sulfurovum sp.]|nr:MAG: D-alanyl-D-alanine carboxypeptidase/D-alanyl-D-alanine-endopeptidase [Sulfurovum sp.]